RSRAVVSPGQTPAAGRSFQGIRATVSLRVASRTIFSRTCSVYSQVVLPGTLRFTIAIDPTRSSGSVSTAPRHPFSTNGAELSAGTVVQVEYLRRLRRVFRVKGLRAAIRAAPASVKPGQKGMSDLNTIPDYPVQPPEWVEAATRDLPSILQEMPNET